MGSLAVARGGWVKVGRGWRVGGRGAYSFTVFFSFFFHYWGRGLIFFDGFLFLYWLSYVIFFP